MKQVNIQSVVNVIAAFDQQMDTCLSTAKQIKDAWSSIEAKLMSRQKAKLVPIKNHKAKACFVRDHLSANADLREQCDKFIKLYDRLTDPKAA